MGVSGQLLKNRNRRTRGLQAQVAFALHQDRFDRKGCTAISSGHFFEKTEGVVIFFISKIGLPYFEGGWPHPASLREEINKPFVFTNGPEVVLLLKVFFGQLELPVRIYLVGQLQMGFSRDMRTGDQNRNKDQGCKF